MVMEGSSLPPKWNYDYRERLAHGEAELYARHDSLVGPFEIARRNQAATLRDPDPDEKLQLENYIAEATMRASLWAQQPRRTSDSPVYQTLSYNGYAHKHTRVLELFAGGFDAPLRGQLHHVDLEFEFTWAQDRSRLMTLFGIALVDWRPLCYTALSYVWGDSATDYAIDVNKSRLSINRSLDTALRYLRKEDGSVVLWVDQICINQVDTREKEHQILLMRLIYTRAWNTVLWLGPEPDRGAFKSLDLIDGATGDFLSQEEREYMCGFFRREPAMVAALANLFCRPWFTRTWTIQEAVLSQRPYLMTGSVTVPLIDFGNCLVLRDLGILETATAGHEAHGKILAGLGAAIALWALSEDIKHLQNLPLLLDSLVETRYAAVTNPLDKVYGILGMCRHSIIPDYSKSAETVFQECMASAMREELLDVRNKSLEGLSMSVGHHTASKILCCVDHDTTSTTAIPSWVPDWSKPRLTTSLAYTTSTLSIYKAGGPFVNPDVIKLADDNATLLVRANIFDTVHWLSKPLTDATLSADNPKENNASLVECITFTTSQQTTPPTSPNFLPFCNTIVAGKDGTGLQACGDDYIEILSLLCDETSGARPTFHDQIYSVRQKKGHFTTDHLKRRNPGRQFQRLKQAYKAAMLGRCLCWTRGGRLALVPRFARLGDVVVVIPGCPVPFVLRRREGDEYCLVGECYVHGVMDGSLDISSAWDALPQLKVV